MTTNNARTKPAPRLEPVMVECLTPEQLQASAQVRDSLPMVVMNLDLYLPADAEQGSVQAVYTFHSPTSASAFMLDLVKAATKAATKYRGAQA